MSHTCPISAYLGLSGNWFMCFQYKRGFSGEQEKEAIICVRMG